MIQMCFYLPFSKFDNSTKLTTVRRCGLNKENGLALFHFVIKLFVIHIIFMKLNSRQNEYFL